MTWSHLFSSVLELHFLIYLICILPEKGEMFRV